MKAVVIAGGRVHWEERPDPEPGPQDLLVRVAAAGLNRADLLQEGGHYPPPAGVPADQPGLECAGVVEAVGGGVTRFRKGDRVMGLLGGAAQAELAVIGERLAMAVPPGMGTAEAGAFPEAFCTAYDALFTQGALAIGERLLVTGAAGGVGTAGVQLGVAGGATVVASVRHQALQSRLERLGARSSQPEEAFSLGPFDVVLELVAGPSVPSALASLAPWGRILVIGTGAGDRSQLDLRQLMGRRAMVRGSTLRDRTLEQKALVARQVEKHVLPLIDQGRVKVIVDTVFPFSRAGEAYERFAAGGKFGKLVLASDG